MKFRRVLPIAFGLISVALMAWDIQEVVTVAEMEVSDIEPSPVPAGLLFTLNAPVTPLFGLVATITGDAVGFRCLFFLPMLLAWWWWLGTRLDFGLLGREPARYPRWAKSLTGIVAGVLFLFAIQDFVNAYQYVSAMAQHFRYAMLAIKPIGAGLWCALLAAGTGRASILLFRGTYAAPAAEGTRLSSAGFWVILLGVAMLGIGRMRGRALDLLPIPKPPPVLSTVSGTISDESGNLLDNVGLELWRVGKRDQGKSTTAHSGVYSFQVEPGEYLLAVNCQSCLSAPTAQVPFASIYYPGVERETEAAHIVVGARATVKLKPLRLQRIPVVAIPAEVRWANGERVDGGNFVFNNLDYPHSITEGQPSRSGEVRLPVGFRYRARASVVCDDGKKLSFHESRPLFEFELRPRRSPKKMQLVIPEMPCRLWVLK